MVIFHLVIVFFFVLSIIPPFMLFIFRCLLSCIFRTYYEAFVILFRGYSLFFWPIISLSWLIFVLSSLQFSQCVSFMLISYICVFLGISPRYFIQWAFHLLLTLSLVSLSLIVFLLVYVYLPCLGPHLHLFNALF